MKSKQSFTLIEVLVAMTILSLAAVAVGWQMAGLLAHHRQISSRDALKAAFEEVQMLCLIHRTDAALWLKVDADRITYQILSDEPLPVFRRPPQELVGIRAVCCEEGTKKRRWLRSHTKSEPITFTCLSSGRIEPASLLQLYREEEQESVGIDLRTPLLIK